MGPRMNLFDRLPPGVFALLTGNNKRRAWDLLVRISERFFSADCVPPYPEGYLHDQITKELERFLLEGEWDESEVASKAPLNIQANQLLGRLIDTGWLIEDKVGVRSFISMRPVVARFFEVLDSFVQDGPQLVGGSIQMIHSQLKSVATDPKGQAAGFHSAAQLCSRLINSLNSTTVRVRDLIKDLTQEDATSIFVKRFFTEHIEEIYVRDFRQMRTENHPLMLRFEIISLVRQVTSEEPAYSLLLEGYNQLPKLLHVSAEEALARDVSRFERLLDVEKFLERMDRVIDAATRRALAYLNYRLRASERVEDILRSTAERAGEASRLGIPVEGRLLSPDPIVAEYRLRSPTSPPAKPIRRAMIKRQMTPRERAELLIRKAMIAHRDTTPAAVRKYINTYLQPGEKAPAESLPINTVSDAVAMVVLIRYALLAEASPQAFEKSPLLRNLGIAVTLTPGQRIETEYFEMPAFIVMRRP